jgi:hypothetical protein
MPVAYAKATKAFVKCGPTDSDTIASACFSLYAQTKK